MSLLLIYLTGALNYWLGMVFVDGFVGDSRKEISSHLRRRIASALLWPVSVVGLLYILAHHLGKTFGRR